MHCQLLGQFIEVHKSHFFQKLENLVETVLLSFFNSILKHWGLTSPLKTFKWVKETQTAPISNLKKESTNITIQTHILRIVVYSIT